MERKRIFRLACAVLLALAALGCNGASGPQKALNSLARALDDNDSAAFLAGMDMKAYAENHIRNLAANDPALRALGSLGRLFRLGNVDQLLSGALDMKAQMEADFTRGVSTGELMARCRTDDTPECPWVPEALRDAKIVELNAEAAIAKITTPARLTSWIALRKLGERWLVVGRAALEQTARQYALDAGVPE
ncbi:hypothetical protein, partial [Desulfovibrio sp.]|uniref:hypothetical protein n=1 Tax=Desulfovibrio sp. TaxID=885 RepID=UPI0023CA4905